MGKVVQSISNDQWTRKDGKTGPSVDTGAFKLSVVRDSNMTKPLQSLIQSNSKYAKWLEYGTSPRAKLYSGPRKHFRNTTAKNKQNIINIVKKAIANI